MFEADDPVGDPVIAGLTEAIEAVCREDRSGWSAAARAQRVRGLAALADRLNGEVVRAVDELDRDRGWQVDGAVSAHGWLTAFTPLSRSGASDLVRAARFRRRFDTTAAALTSGELTTARLTMLARRVTPERADLYERDEAMLLGLATSMGRTDDVRVVVNRWAALADDELAAADADAAHRRRHLSVSRGMNRWGFLDGELTPDGFAVLKAALAAVDTPDPDDVDGGPRTPAQRRADGLVDICRRFLSGHTTTAGPAAAVQVVIDADLLGLVDDEPVDEDPGARHVDPRTARCENLDPDPIPIGVETARRLLCDSYISRAVLRGRSEVLDLGRFTRLFTAPQRRLIILRDGGCIAHGCDRGPPMVRGPPPPPLGTRRPHRPRQRRPRLLTAPPPRPRRRLARPHRIRRHPPSRPRTRQTSAPRGVTRAGRRYLRARRCALT